MGLGAATDGVPEAPVALVNFVLSLAVALVTKGEFPAADVFKALVSRVLGYAVVAGAAVIKLPQILAVLRSGSADGISALSLEIESLAYGVSLASMLQSKLPFSAYGDLVFVVVQNAVLLSLVHMKSDVGFVRATAPSAVMASLAASFYLGHIPPNVVEMATSFTIAVIIAARVPQIVSNYSNGSTGQLSGMSQFMMLGGGLARLFTGIQDGASSSIIVATITGVVLNAIIMLQIVLYSGTSSKTTTKKKATTKKPSKDTKKKKAQ